MGQKNGKYIIGITGNIATGKSLVRKMLQHLGAYPIDADGLAHQVMAPGAPAYRPVIEWFGKWILSAEGRIDRERLGAAAFSHPLALKRLESITHPIIGKAIDVLISRAQQPVVVVEAIKLLEGDLADKVDAIWVVNCSEEAQLQRLIQKRGLSEEEARKRIHVQNPQAEKLAAAHIIINNDGDMNATFAQVQAAWRKIGGETDVDEEGKTVQVQSTTAAIRQFEKIKIKRPKASDLEAIASLLNLVRGRQLTREGIMESFTETSYLAALGDGEIVGVVSFVVENLITQSSEVALLPDVPVEPILKALIEEMEEAADSLQSEVSFIYLRQEEAADIIDLLQKHLEYEILERVENIKFPAWREALRARPEGTIILYKKLREDRILTPF